MLQDRIVPAPSGLGPRRVSEPDAIRAEMDRIKREEATRQNLRLLAFELNVRS
jgi:hypothetical protein